MNNPSVSYYKKHLIIVFSIKCIDLRTVYHISHLKEVQLGIATLVSSVTIENNVAKCSLICINVYH